MEPPKGIWAQLLSFLYFLPFFVGLLLLGLIKGIIFCPLICVIMAAGNSAVILGLWPAHFFWTLYSIASAKQLGPYLKIVLCISVSFLLVIWPLFGISASILGGAGYGFLAPLFATFNAVGGKTGTFTHCFLDGTWSTMKGCVTAVRDFTDVCFHTFFSVMDDVRLQDPINRRPYEIRFCQLVGAILLGLVGVVVDALLIVFIALYKSPCMLFKGWNRLIHDLIGREGPFLETMCVPFAGLAILLWPLMVVGAIIASVISSIFLGAYASVVVYQESSIRMGLNYVFTSISIFDEYTNDVLDLQEGSCFPRFQYRKELPSQRSSARPMSFSGKVDVKAPPSRSTSLTSSIIEFKLLDLIDNLFTECKHHGISLVCEGLITSEDVENFKSRKRGSHLISVGLPAFCIFKALVRSAHANSDGLLLSDCVTEITNSNKPKDVIFGWFFDPLMVIKEQIKVENLSEEEEKYLGDLVLMSGNTEHAESWYIDRQPQTERRRAEIEALARRLQGITKSMLKYPTMRRQMDGLIKCLFEELGKKNDSYP